MTPSSNVSVERDFHSWAPEGVFVHAARMLMREATVENALALATEYAPRAADELSTLEPDVVVFCCTGAGASLGPDGERELIDRLAGLAQAPVVSTNRAVIAAMRAHQVESVAIITPYTDDQTSILAAAREAEGWRVAAAAGMGIGINREIARVGVEELVEFSEAALRDAEFELLFVSCTNLSTAAALPVLEQRFGVPVVTSNRASFDAAMAVLGEPAEAI
ncbi:MAG: aspartate/glutamate racemase family protein [Actinobacteria bacterium]|nr:aspartate/glutamate racemase family protein [Actinomycetota bacterium]